MIPNWVVIGHRGTGKTSFLKRWAQYRPAGQKYFDLDAEIEKTVGLSIAEIFARHGEAWFREQELKIFRKLISETQTVVSVGAGFPVGAIPDDVKVLWLQRRSDRRGRIFLNRPRLLPAKKPLEEFLELARTREPQFRKRADFTYVMPEGQIENSRFAQNLEKTLFVGAPPKVGGVRTLLPGDSHLLAEPDWVEIRDDLWSPEEIEVLFKKWPADKILFSVRRGQTIPAAVGLVDVPYDKLALRDQWPAQSTVISTHADDVEDGIRQLLLAPPPFYNLKLCPRVESWADLEKGDLWQREDPQRRSFLPRSASGRWAWYRLWQKQKINFWREGAGSAPDQPTLSEWMATGSAPFFGAVLGSPIEHSFSPIEHFDFFHERQARFFGIEIKEHEWSQALKFLEARGLRAAAVTAPHKKNAAESCAVLTGPARELGAVNTLSLVQGAWCGANTDILGLTEIFSRLNLPGPVAVWGGQGVISSLQKVIPGFSHFSSRTGQLKSGPGAPPPKTLVWAAPVRDETSFPPEDWRPEVIFDLNYAENSGGLAYAQRLGVKYHSGLAFFRAQALEQQQIWKDSLERK